MTDRMRRRRTAGSETECSASALSTEVNIHIAQTMSEVPDTIADSPECLDINVPNLPQCLEGVLCPQIAALRQKEVSNLISNFRSESSEWSSSAV